MFNIGFGELIAILAIAFLVVGPSDLPKVARSIAKLYKRARKLWSEVMAAINLDAEMEDIKETKKEVELTIKESNPVEAVKREIADVKQTVKVTQKEAEEQFSK